MFRAHTVSLWCWSHLSCTCPRVPVLVSPAPPWVGGEAIAVEAPQVHEWEYVNGWVQEWEWLGARVWTAQFGMPALAPGFLLITHWTGPTGVAPLISVHASLLVSPFKWIMLIYTVTKSIVGHSTPELIRRHLTLTCCHILVMFGYSSCGVILYVSTPMNMC